MSNKQSVWKKISDKFKGFFNKNKALPEGRGENVELQNRHQKFVKKLQKSNVIEQPVYVENSIENAIQQYLYSYLTQLQNNNVQQGDVAYRALTELAGKKEQDNKSYFAEQESLFSELQKNDYNLQDQAGTFMHIRNENFIKTHTKSEDINARLYLNPTRANSTELACQILNKMGKNPIYLKILRDNSIKNGASRNEKIVIYLRQDEVPQVTNNIMQILKERPELFNDANYMNPFMKSIGGIMSYAPNPQTDMYRQIDGNIVNVSKSYNSVLSKALDDSTRNAIRDLMPDEYNPNDFPKALKQTIEQDSTKLINRIKEYLQVSQLNNSILDIKGIENIDRKTNEER